MRNSTVQNALNSTGENPVVIYPVYKQLTNSSAGSIMLGYLMYWLQKKNTIYKTDKEISQDTGLSVNEIRTVKPRIKKLPFLSTFQKGTPPKTYYTLDEDMFSAVLEELSKEGISRLNVLNQHDSSFMQSSDTGNKSTAGSTAKNNRKKYRRKAKRKTAGRSKPILEGSNCRRDAIQIAEGLQYNTKTTNKDYFNSSNEEYAVNGNVDTPVKFKVDKPPKIVPKKSTPVPKKKKSAPKKKKSPDIPDFELSAHKKVEPKPGYKYTTMDIQLYNELMDLGAVCHKTETKAYYNTMDKIHRLLNPSKCTVPFANCKAVPKDYKTKVWNFDEILDAFKYYLSRNDKPRYKNIGNFIYTDWGERTHSPLVRWHIDFIKNSGATLTGDKKILVSGLRKIGINSINHEEANRLIKLIDVHVGNARVPAQLAHEYFNNPIYVFLAYVKDRQNNLSFKPGYIRGENFIKEFVEDALKHRRLVKGNGYAI